ncbi:cell division protein FtsB [Acidihalobacter prosperus]
MTSGNKFLILILSAVLLLLQYKLWFGEGSLSDIHRLHHKLAIQKAKNARQKDSNAALAAEVVALRKGTSAVEEMARSRLGMIQQGDTFYQYVYGPSAQKGKDQLKNDKQDKKDHP